MAGYKGIKFAKGYDRPFADFKVEFGSNWIFMAIPEKKRNAELKKVHKMVLKETNDVKKQTPKDGNSKGSVDQGTDTHSSKSE